MAVQQYSVLEYCKGLHSLVCSLELERRTDGRAGSVASEEPCLLVRAARESASSSAESMTAVSCQTVPHDSSTREIESVSTAAASQCVILL